MLFQLNPIAFTILGLEIRWYGILICAGMVIASWLISKRAPLHNIKSDDILDMLLVSLPLGIIGARAYYVLFNWSLYEGNIMKIINIREGGLAIHGGLLLGLGSAAIIAWRKKINILNLLDLVVPGVALAQSIGRWGNFFNQEAHGGPTTLPWAIEINGEMVHPTFLYESLWCLFLFLFLSYFDKKSAFTGQIFLLYGILYSAERGLVEQLRTDSLMIGPYKTAQLASIAIIAICVTAYVYLNRQRR